MKDGIGFSGGLNFPYVTDGYRAGSTPAYMALYQLRPYPVA
jgi:hypothetical protein